MCGQAQQEQTGHVCMPHWVQCINTFQHMVRSLNSQEWGLTAMYARTEVVYCVAVRLLGRIPVPSVPVRDKYNRL